MGTHAFLAPTGTINFPGILNFKYDALDVVSKTIDGPTVIKYFVGGLAGTLVATLTIAYDVDGDILTVVRT